MKRLLSFPLRTFSIDTSTFITQASNIFNALFPVFAVIAGISLGIGLVRYIVNAIRNVF